MEFKGNLGQCARQAVSGRGGTGKSSSWADLSLGFCHEGAVGGQEGTEARDDGEHDGVWHEGAAREGRGVMVGGLREQGERPGAE